MPEHAQLYPMPTQEDYLKAVSTINTTFQDTSAERIMAAQFHAPSFKTGIYLKQAERAGLCIEPTDRSTGELIDPNRPKAKAFVIGAKLGLMVVAQAHRGMVEPSEIYQALDTEFPLSLADSDRFDTMHEVADTIIQMGRAGYALAGDRATDIMEGWADILVPSVIHQLAFKAGTGLALNGARRVHRRRIDEHHRRTIRDALENPRDIEWDALLR